MKILSLSLLLAGGLPLLASPEPMRLSLAAPVDRWDEAIPLGNGRIGGLLWGSGNELRLSLDRADLWDVRQHPIYANPNFTYATVLDRVRSGRTADLNREFAHPSEFPTKLPGARLVVTLAPTFQACTFSLDLRTALGSVDFGSARAECFFSESSPAALLLLPDRAANFDLVANPAVKKLGYPDATVTRTEREVTLVQDAADGFRYVIHVNSRVLAEGTLLAIAITTRRDSEDPVALARRQTADALATGYPAARARHLTWWETFWERSAVALPDPALQQHYNLVRYFYGAASRRGAPPIALQGLWTADAGTLPPWRGDYHHNLNTQLTYWAYLASGHFEQGLSFIDFMWSHKPAHERFARDFFGLARGLVVPGVMSLDGRAMGSWFPYTLSPTMGAWAAQSFYWHWRHEMDARFLEERAYPYCAAVGEALADLLRPDPATGRLRLPLSSSPEIHNNGPRAWLTPNSNFDHALLQWLFLANAELATALGREAEAGRWRSLHAKLGPLAVSDAGVLLVAPGEALAASHRHHSQLMAIHPLGLVHPENGAADRRIIDATLADVDRLGTSSWTGYSFSWMAALRARVGRGDEALRFLSGYLEHTTARNGFHLNGVVTGSTLSSYRGRAFTLEGNFAAMQAVHEMLLQSWGGRLRIFPALPASWLTVSFRDLRAEGGFAVFAERRDGRVRRVSVRASVPQDLRLTDPFAGRALRHNLPIERDAGEIRVRLTAGQTLELHEEPPPLDLGARILPVPADARFSHPDWHIWCGAPIHGSDGKFHLLYSRWPVAAGFAPGWALHSEIAYAVADRPLGPYRHVNVALPARGIDPATGRKYWDGDVTHNPNILRHPNGRYYLYYMGNHGDGTSYPMHRNHQRIGLAVADHPAGPWRRFDAPIIDVSRDPSAFDSLCVTNPAATVRPDGGILLVYKAVQIIEGKVMGGNVRYGAALAAAPEGPYVKTPGRIFEADSPGAAGHWMVAEDPFLWHDARDGGRYYAVARDVVGAFTGSSGGLALFSSMDGLQWSAAPQPRVLGNRFTWADGTPGRSQVERPALLFVGGEPVALFGATDGYRKDGVGSFNVQIPLGPGAHASLRASASLQTSPQ